jgi:DNA polymerase-4
VPSQGGLPILHVDMDSFYVSVEVLRDPTLAGRPVVVGGTGRRGVVASASYEARVYGIRSAMPTARARHLCPEAVFIQGDHAQYRRVSAEIHRILSEITPIVEPIALDEAFLDVRGARRLFGDGPEIARLIRPRILDRTGLHCSVGVAANKLLAKLASEAAKPRVGRRGIEPGVGVVVIEREREIAFLHGHPVQALWGVGPTTLRRLERLGVRIVGDVARLPAATLEAAVGVAHGRHLAALARGEDDRPVEADRPPKSIGHEETFPDDVTDRRQLEVIVVRLADAVATRLRAHGVIGHTVTLKLRYGDFRTITRSTTLGAPVDDAVSISAAARGLLAALDVAAGIRLAGVAVSRLESNRERQLSLDEREAGWTAASDAVDAIRARFGDDAIGPASVRSGRPD